MISFWTRVLTLLQSAVTVVLILLPLASSADSAIQREPANSASGVRCNSKNASYWSANARSPNGVAFKILGTIHGARPAVGDSVSARCWIEHFDLVILETHPNIPQTDADRRYHPCVDERGVRLWHKAVLLTYQSIYSWAALRPVPSMESLARETSAQLTGFENPMSQLTMLDKVSCEVQVRILAQAFADAQSGASTRSFIRLIRAYDQSRVEELEGAIRTLGDDDICNCKDLLEPILFEERNARFVEVMAALNAHTTRKVLVLVGVGHLVGQHSLLNQLRRAGFAVGSFSRMLVN